MQGIATMFKRGLIIAFGVGILLANPALAQDRPLARLAELVTAKGHKDVHLGNLCQIFSIQVGVCSGYQVFDDEAHPRPSFNTLKDAGVDRIILAIHDPKTGFAYLTGVSGRLEAAAKGTGGNAGKVRRGEASTRREEFNYMIRGYLVTLGLLVGLLPGLVIAFILVFFK